MFLGIYFTLIQYITRFIVGLSLRCVQLIDCLDLQFTSPKNIGPLNLMQDTWDVCNGIFGEGSIFLIIQAISAFTV